MRSSAHEESYEDAEEPAHDQFHDTKMLKSPKRRGSMTTAGHKRKTENT